MHKSTNDSNPGVKKPRRSSWLLLLAIGLAALLLYLAVRNVSWQEMLQTFSQIQPGYLVFLFLILTASLFARGLRWGTLLSSEKKIPAFIMFFATAVGYLGNTFLPARAGELLRSVMLGRKEKISSGFIFATALTERVIDVVILVLLGVISILQMKGLPDWMTRSVGLMAALGIIALAVLIIAPRLKKIFHWLANKLPMKEQWKSKLLELLDQFLQGSQAFLHTRSALGFLGLSVVVWFLDASGLVLLAAAFRLSLSYPQALLFLAALGLSSAIPSTPGYVGIYQFVAVTLLPVFGFTTSQALTFILTSQGVNVIGVVLWGLLGFIPLGTKEDTPTPSKTVQ